MTKPASASLLSPLFTPPQATALLDQIIYEQILECVDLEALYHLEQSITLMVADLHAMPHDRASETTQTLIDRCLLRLPDDIRRFLRAGPLISFGPGDPDCPDCRDEHDRDRATSGRDDRPGRLPRRPPPRVSS